jgi:hypothetical protein
MNQTYGNNPSSLARGEQQGVRYRVLGGGFIVEKKGKRKEVRTVKDKKPPQNRNKHFTGNEPTMEKNLRPKEIGFGDEQGPLARENRRLREENLALRREANDLVEGLTIVGVRLGCLRETMAESRLRRELEESERSARRDLGLLIKTSFPGNQFVRKPLVGGASDEPDYRQKYHELLAKVNFFRQYF